MSTDALATLRFHYAHRDHAARVWHASGGKVVGYFCDTVPAELIMAAGFLPYRVTGDPSRGRELVERHVAGVRPPFTRRAATVGFVETAVDALLGGALDFVDHLVVPHTRKMVAAVYRQLVLARRSAPELTLPNLHFLDKASVPSPATTRFHHDIVDDFAVALATWSGTPLTAEALNEAVETANTGRALLRRVAELRRADPPLLSGTDALAIIGSAQVMPRDTHNRLLAELLDTLQEMPRRGRGSAPIRIHLAGSPQDHPAVYQAIEDLGAVVVAEDHCWGNRAADGVLTSGQPALDAIAARYDAAPACSVSFPLRRTVDRCLAAATASRPDGVIVVDLAGDEAQLWETPDEIAGLHAVGIPTLHLAQQPYTSTCSADTAEKISRFLEELNR